MDRTCPMCSDQVAEVVMEVIPYHGEKGPHYGFYKCPNCGHELRNVYAPKPQSDPTKYRRPKSTTSLARTTYCELCLRHKRVLPSMQTLEGHHVIPCKYDGANTIDNIWTLCTGCHRLVEYMRKYHGGDPSELF